MARPKKATVALIYDFDGTLSPGNMQEYGFIQAADLDANTFWEKNTKGGDFREKISPFLYILNLHL